MKNLIYFLMILVVVVACKKDDTETDSPTTNGKLSVTYSFDQPSDLDNWQTSGTTTLEIDMETKYEGAGSMKLMDTVACHQITMVNPIEVSANTHYQISLASKFEGEFVCASIYNFALKLKQGSEITLEQIGGNDWKTDVITFQSDSTGLPLYIEFKLSNSTGWIDNLKIEEVE